VPGGWWKASRICAGDYALVSEAVAPGFDYADNEIASMASIAQHFPKLLHLLEQYIKK
jgi:predicted cupin superfamily sugar epimerase